MNGVNIRNRMIHFPKMAGLLTNSKLKQILKGMDGVNMKNLRIIRVMTLSLVLICSVQLIKN